MHVSFITLPVQEPYSLCSSKQVLGQLLSSTQIQIKAKKISSALWTLCFGEVFMLQWTTWGRRKWKVILYSKYMSVLDLKRYTILTMLGLALFTPVVFCPFGFLSDHLVMIGWQKGFLFLKNKTNFLGLEDQDQEWGPRLRTAARYHNTQLRQAHTVSSV